MSASAGAAGSEANALITHLGLVLVQLLYGVTSVVGRLGLRATNPVAFTVGRLVLATPCLFLLLVASGEPEALRLPPRAAAPGLLLGALSLAVANLGMTVGIALSGQVTASTWQPMQLLFTALISLVLGFEAPRPRKLLGIACGLLGTALVVALDPQLSAGRLAGKPASGWGHVALFCCVLASSVLFILRNLLTRKHGLTPKRVVAWTHLAAALLLLATGVCLERSEAARAVLCGGCASVLAVPTSRGTWAALAFYSAVPTMVCQLLIAWASKRADPSAIAMYSGLQPVTTTGLSVLLRALAADLRGVLAPPAVNVVGGLPVVLGIWLAARDGPPREAAEKKLE